jgi:hypothetical protein
MNNELNAYSPPAVEVLGNLSELTRGNSGNAGGYPDVDSYTKKK